MDPTEQKSDDIIVINDALENTISENGRYCIIFFFSVFCVTVYSLIYYLKTYFLLNVGVGMYCMCFNSINGLKLFYSLKPVTNEMYADDGTILDRYLEGNHFDFEDTSTPQTRYFFIYFLNAF